jgi:hypothetical protein
MFWEIVDWYAEKRTYGACVNSAWFEQISCNDEHAASSEKAVKMSMISIGKYINDPIARRSG